MPGWNPAGVFWGLKNIHPATSSLALLFPDSNENTTSRAPVTVTNPESLWNVSGGDGGVGVTIVDEIYRIFCLNTDLVGRTNI